LNANEWERDGSGENGLELRGVLRSNWRRTEVWLKSLSPNQIVDQNGSRGGTFLLMIN